MKEACVKFEINSSWLIGNENSLNFWLDNWAGQTLTSLLNSPPCLHGRLKSKSGHFIEDHNINLLDLVINLYPRISSLTQNIVIANDVSKDKKVWRLESNGILTFKITYSFKANSAQEKPWGKIIWIYFIPHTKPLLL